MRNTLAIAGREIQAYFVSPIAYVVTAAFLVINSIFFAWYVGNPNGSEATMQYLFNPMTTIFLFIMPMLTMRLLAEEQRSGTIELLLTSPVRDFEVVLGKFLGAMVLVVVMLALSLFYPFIMFRFGAPDPGPIATGYLGLLLLAGSLVSLGVFASSLTQNQIVAVIIGLVLDLGFWLIEAVADLVGAPLSNIFTAISIHPHFPDFTRGIIETRDVVFYLTFIAVALFLASRTVESRRWR
jgi:ABC-2 type transport system permease protein